MVEASKLPNLSEVLGMEGLRGCSIKRGLVDDLVGSNLMRFRPDFKLLGSVLLTPNSLRQFRFFVLPLHSIVVQ